MMSEVKTVEKSQTVSDAFVDMLWSPYEALVAYARKSNVNNDLWRKTYGDARKWVQDRRQQTEQVYHEAVQKGNEMIFGGNESLKKVAEKYQEIALTPVHFFLGQFDKIDRTWIDRSDEAEKSSDEYTSYFWSMHDNMTESLKNQQRVFFRLMNDDLRDWSRAGKGV